jgi:hypothetical protein
MVCAGLLIAAPLALVVTGGPEAGPTREPEGVLTGNPDDGRARGGGAAGGVTDLATTSARSPAPNGSAADAGTGATGTDGPGGTVGGEGTAAAVGDTGTAAGSHGAGNAPAGNAPAGNAPAGDGGSSPQPQPQPDPGKDVDGVPCPCTVINGVLRSLSALAPSLP